MLALATFDAHESQRILALHGAELAPFWRRAVAFVLDLLFSAVLFALVGSVVEPVLLRQGWVQNDQEIVYAFNLNWYSIVWAVAYFGLATYLGNGKTPGKALLRIRILSLIQPRISLWHSLERALGYGASLLEFGFGFVQYFIHPNKRTVHDRIAETIVVLELKTRKVRENQRKNPAARRRRKTIKKPGSRMRL